MQVSRRMFTHGQSWNTISGTSLPLPPHLRQGVLVFAMAYGRVAENPLGILLPASPLSMLGFLISAFTWLLGPKLIPNSGFKCFSY